MREQCPEDFLLQLVSRGSAWINLNAITQIVLGFSSESAKISARKYCEIRRRRQLHCRLFSFFLTVLLIAGCSADSHPLEQLKWNPFFNAFILTYMHVMGGGGLGLGWGLGWGLGRPLRDSRTKMLICPFLFTGHATRSTQSRSAERQS